MGIFALEKESCHYVDRENWSAIKLPIFDIKNICSMVSHWKLNNPTGEYRLIHIQ